MQDERPGPLRDLPLERFIPEVNVSHSHSLPILRPRISSNKRPASPERLPDGSPAKRRLLADERGIATSPRPSRLSLVHSTSVPDDISILDGKKADAPVEYPQRAKVKEASFDLPWGHNGTTSAKPRRAMTRLSAVSPLAIYSTQIPRSSDLLSPSEGVVVDTALAIGGPHASTETCDSGSMHYPGFPIYHDSSAILAGNLSCHGHETLSSRSASFQHSSDLDKENIFPAESLAPPFMLKNKTKPAVSSPFSPASGTATSSPNLRATLGHYDPVPITPLARSLQSTKLTQSSPCTPKVKLGRTSSLGSPFLGSTTPRRTPIGKSERLSLRRQLTEEADGMDLL